MLHRIPVRALGRPACLLRHYSDTPKVPMKLIAELRKTTEVSLTKAREALVASNNDVPGALLWLQKDLEVSGAKRAAKLQDRAASEGLVAHSILSQGTRLGAVGAGVRASMIELNCETDFVARNDLFSKLADDIAHTAAFISDPPTARAGSTLVTLPLDMLLHAPLLSANPTAFAMSPTSPQPTVASAIRDNISKLGENISLRRALTANTASLRSLPLDLGLRIGAYVHGSHRRPNQGRICALALYGLKSPRLVELVESATFVDDLERLERALARQIVGFKTHTVHGTEETALEAQPFMMFAESEGKTVREALSKWAAAREMVPEGVSGGVIVHEFAKWTVGEDLCEPATDTPAI